MQVEDPHCWVSDTGCRNFFPAGPGDGRQWAPQTQASSCFPLVGGERGLGKEPQRGAVRLHLGPAPVSHPGEEGHGDNGFNQGE